MDHHAVGVNPTRRGVTGVSLHEPPTARPNPSSVNGITATTGTIEVLVFAGSTVTTQRLVDAVAGAERWFHPKIVARPEALLSALEPEKDAILVLGVPLAQVDTTKFVRQILAARPKQAIVAVADPKLEPFPSRLLHAGVRGYLLESVELALLSLALRLVAAGYTFLASPVSRALNQEIARQGEDQPALSPAGAKLTRREANVLALLARGASNREIAASLQLSERTVENHVYTLYRKLGIHDRAHAALAALRGVDESLSLQN
jgi:DNA-binding NarL/FixJ family response regulator